MSNNELKSLLSDGDAATPEGRIVRVMSERGAISAAEVARATGLARSTISTALAELAALAGRSSRRRRPRGARRRAPGGGVRARTPKAGTCVGLHLGMDEMRLLVADVSHSVIFENTIPLGRDYSPAVGGEAARRAVRDVYERRGLSLRTLLGVGIAVSGPVAPDGRIQRASIVPTWAGVNVREVFEPALERPIFADNESNCAAIAEMTWGAAIGREDFVLFKIDVGVGGAIVSHGRVLTGIAGAGGEFGHMTIDPRGRPLPMRQSRLPRTDRQPQSGARDRRAVAGARNHDRGAHRHGEGRRRRLRQADRRHRGNRRPRASA